jgi:hypothetical protein
MMGNKDEKAEKHKKEKHLFISHNLSRASRQADKAEFRTRITHVLPSFQRLSQLSQKGDL